MQKNKNLVVTEQPPIKRPRFRTMFNDQQPDRGEVNKEPSMTEPNLAMSIQEMFLRFASGRTVDQEKVVHYGYDEEGNPLDDGHPDLTTMGPVERQEYMEQQRQQLQQMKTELHEKARIAKEKKAGQQTAATAATTQPTTAAAGDAVAAV